MSTPGVPAPSFAARIGDVVERRRDVAFQELRSRSLVNRLIGTGMPFGWTVNPFRGCEMGCRYCYARNTHEYLGHCEPEEFERRIYVKRAGSSGLLAELRRARDSGREIAIGSVTDPYQPGEARFEITRSVLERLTEVPGARVGITTKSALVSRDVALLGEIARASEIWVNVSLISLDADLLRLVEPRAPRPDLRLAALRTIARAGIPTRLFIMPVLPMLTDGETGIRDLLQAAHLAGAREAIAQGLFLSTPIVHRFFLEFVEREFPWALARYRTLYPTPGRAPREYASSVTQLVARLAREVGLQARSRQERVESESPPRPRQLSLLW